MAKRSVCSVPGCEKKKLARGLCGAHYQRWRKFGDPLLGGPIAERAPQGAGVQFLRDVAANPPDECVIWPYYIDDDGYGKVRWRGRQRSASRVAWEFFHGRPPSDEMEIAHKPIVCHNRACVNPLHLEEATTRENALHRKIDGSNAQGARHGMSKLCEDDIREIRKSPLGAAELAAKFNVTRRHINAILRRSVWCHVD